jgi:ABC-type sugar transport system substrate-binding protein
MMLAIAVVAAGVLAAGSSGARQTQRTIGLITQNGAEGFFGEVFTADNGGDCPPLDDPYLTSVRVGAEEIVCPGDPAKLGYLTVWAANYLARGHTLTPGSVRVGGPVGTVQYFKHNQELRLGPPITITKANLAKYAGKPCPPGTTYPC